MFECRVVKEERMTCVTPRGRIDALSAAEMQRIFDERVLEGERVLLVDMADVGYVSSAGLRVFVKSQKELKKVGGEILLAALAPAVSEIFKMSGFERMFTILPERSRLPEGFARDVHALETTALDGEGLAVRYRETPSRAGTFFVVGSEDNLEKAAYGEADVAAVKASEMPWGCGLATLGDAYGEYRHLFGEAVILGGSFFFYPAVRHASVDYVIREHQDPAATCKFLNGFGFSGGFRYLLSFQGTEGPVSLPSLVRGFFALSGADALGVALVAESKGLWGMNLKQVPVVENRPENGGSLFDSENFPRWFDFPVEPAFTNHIVAAAGVAFREGSRPVGGTGAFPAGEKGFHFHGAIFDRGPLGNDPAAFEGELKRVILEHRVLRVQHLLEASRFGGGLAALAELEV